MYSIIITQTLKNYILKFESWVHAKEYITIEEIVLEFLKYSLLTYFKYFSQGGLCSANFRPRFAESFYDLKIPPRRIFMQVLLDRVLLGFIISVITSSKNRARLCVEMRYTFYSQCSNPILNVYVYICHLIFSSKILYIL